MQVAIIPSAQALWAPLFRSTHVTLGPSRLSNEHAVVSMMAANAPTNMWWAQIELRGYVFARIEHRLTCFTNSLEIRH